MADKHENNRSKLLTRRALLLAGGQAALLGTVAGRLYFLEVVQADRYQMLADENRISIRLIAPPRGRILDRFGVPLASNRSTYRAQFIADQSGDIAATLDAVGRLVPFSDGDRRRVLHDIRVKHGFVPVVLKENMSWDEMSRIEVNTLELAGVSIEQGLMRDYPFADKVAHVVGYVAAVSEQDLSGDDPLLELPDFRIGKNGVEKAFDIQLRGTAGTSQVEVNAFGQVVRELAREDGMSGQEIVLGLDMALQDLAMQRCAAEGSASCVLLDLWTGEVLALASSPSYDPGAFAAGLSAAEWQKLVSDPMNPLSHKAISGTYAPGSTFKPMVAMAALDAGLITPDTEFFCPGEFTLGNAVFHCWKKGGHGAISLNRAIRESCDVFFYHTADVCGIDRLAAMANRFGLGVELGIEIPGERTGLIPTRGWKLATTGETWQRGDTISCGIGQGYVSATPLQLAIYVARIASGRRIAPRLVRAPGVMASGADAAAAPSQDFASMAIAEKHFEAVRHAMWSVANEQHGTAYHARITEPGLEMAGKTGTAQVHHVNKEVRDRGIVTGTSVPWKDRDHALFISFAPADAPRYACAVVVEHGGASGGEGGAVAAPIARDVLILAQKRDPVHRVPETPFGAPARLAQG
ncbi:MAG TPA: penicillin-binding protein 2 [Stellaceae bacterium]|nr:penicillin-binding protein 2 [Stellaceae bacterium]